MWQELPIQVWSGFGMKVIEQPFCVRDLLRAVLEDHVVVGHRDRVRVEEVDLLLAGPGLALRALHLDAGRLHPVPHLADERLVVGRGEDVVVEDVRDRGGEVAVVLRVRLLVGLLEEVELELRADHRREAELGGALDLAPAAPGGGRARRASRRARRRRRGRAPSPRARESGAARRGRASSRSRRSPSPSSRSGSPGSGPSPCRAPGGSCSPRRRGRRRPSSRKYSPSTRLPIRRPCMSVNATTIVSIEPSSTAAVSSSSVSMGEESTRAEALTGTGRAA